MAANDAATLGPWAGSDLARTAHQNAGVGADADLPPDVRFVSGIVQLIRRRAARAEDSDLKQLAVFLLKPVPYADHPDSRPKRVPMLDSGLERLTGRLWFVSAAVSSGYYVPLDGFADDDDLFRFVTDALLLGNVPAIVFDPRTQPPQARFYSSGLGQLDECRTLSLVSGSVSLAQILAVIDRVHKECLVTPDAQPPSVKLWQNNRKWYPIEDAEGRIQGYLKAGLATAFPTCTPRHEQPSTPGRVDLEIEESDPLDRSITVRIAILELKVLRSFGSTGNSVSPKEICEWVESGVKQVAAYREDKGAAGAALCCFDMRRTDTGETCFDHVRDLATARRVELRRWFLFASSESYRDSRYGRS